MGSSVGFICFISTHDLTKRSTSRFRLNFRCFSYFNSRPHEEVDLDRFAFECDIIDISTHDLTKRSTLWAFLQWQDSFYFNSRPHEEVDNGPGDNLIVHRYFNSRPHEEVDEYTSSPIYTPVISTHDLTKRSTLEL